MSLFSVSRYTGDQDESPKKKPKAALDIIQKLQEEAKLRRKSNDRRDKQTLAEQGDTPSPEKAKKKQRKSERDVENDQDTSIEISKEGVDNAISPKKAKKRERLTDDKTDAKHSPVKRKKDESDSNQTIGNNGEVLSENFMNESSKKKNKHKKSKQRNTDTSDLHESDNDKDNAEEEMDGEDDKEKKVEAELVDTGPGSQEIGGFTVIGNIKPTHTEKVMRVLPAWLSSPSVLSSNLKSGLVPVEEMPGLDPDLVKTVLANGIKTFFPVQSQVIPALLTSSATGFLYGRAGYRPSDICVSAPTGSGKTLAFVLPIVQALKSRVRCEVRALAVLPVRDLATQVFRVFEEYCKNTKLKVGCLTGQKQFATEQKSLVKRTLRGYQSQYDIIVATPGRLVDHINKTCGFSLAHLRYLVIDEADRMMDEVKQEWLTQTEAAVYRARPAPTPLSAQSCSIPQTPVQKLLYSATLSQNPERLQPLNLFQPRLFLSAGSTGSTGPAQPRDKKTPVKTNDSSDTAETDNLEEMSTPESKEQVTFSKDDLGKYTTPSELSEYIVETVPERKPLMVLHMLHQLGYRNILCFTNSVEATHRLSTLIQLYGGVSVTELSSSFHVARRNKVIQKFVAGNIDILICSDMVARGIDIANVKYVVSYDPPKFIKTHIHRIGRTARAGKEGVALTMLENKECYHFKKILRQAGKKLPKKMVIGRKDLKPLLPKYKKALSQLPAALKARLAETADGTGDGEADDTIYKDVQENTVDKTDAAIDSDDSDDSAVKDKVKLDKSIERVERAKDGSKSSQTSNSKKKKKKSKKKKKKTQKDVS